MRERRYYVYIVASRSRVLYTGSTSDLTRRIFEHRNGSIPGFTQRYRVSRLVYFEETTDARAAVARERQIKSWSRAKRMALIESSNLGWLDLAGDWFARDDGLANHKQVPSPSLREDSG